MQIQYFGLSSFKITSKDKTAIIDPFSKETGLTPPRGGADIIILSEKDNEIYSYTQSITGEPFMVDGPGEYDVKEHAINGVPIKIAGQNTPKENPKEKSGKEGLAARVLTLYLMEIEGITILNLAHIKKLDLTQEELEDFGNIDILFVPIGGHSVMDYEDAAKAVNLLEPKITIPMHYKIPGLKIEADSEEKFLKEMGGKAERMEKLTIKKKELVEDQTKIIILEPLR